MKAYTLIRTDNNTAVYESDEYMEVYDFAKQQNYETEIIENYEAKR